MVAEVESWGAQTVPHPAQARRTTMGIIGAIITLIVIIFILQLIF